MLKINSVLALIGLISSVSTEFTGPFLIWGGSNLNALKVPALEPIDIQRLHNELSKADAVIIYTRAASTELNESNFPDLSKIIQNEQWLYLPQETLSVQSDLFKTEIIQPKSSTPEEQDREIVEHYKKAQSSHKDVIGILVISRDEFNQSSSEEHMRIKREHYGYKYEYVPGYIFVAHGQGMLYTRSAIVLNHTKSNVVHELKKHVNVTAENEAYGTIFRLNVQFSVGNELIWIKFVFNIGESGAWKMSSIEYDDGKRKELLYRQKDVPSAPAYVSFVCEGSFEYKSYDDTLSLILKDIQVQPRINTYNSRFDGPINCDVTRNYLSPGILSGLFISAICLFVLAIAITTLMNVKTR